MKVMISLRSIVATTLLLAALMSTFTGCNSAGKSVGSKEAKSNIIMTKVEVQDFSIEVTSSSSSGTINLDFNGNYSIVISGNKISCYLPYVGEAFAMPYKSGEGLMFDTDIRNYDIQIVEEGLMHVSFDARSPQDDYKFDIYIWSDGQSQVSVKPILKQAAVYNGTFIF